LWAEGETRRCAPEVVHIDQEGNYAITYPTGDFESFILGPGREKDEDEDEK
jgi:hypothetical protein